MGNRFSLDEENGSSTRGNRNAQQSVPEDPHPPKPAVRLHLRPGNLCKGLRITSKMGGAKGRGGSGTKQNRTFQKVHAVSLAPSL